MNREDILRLEGEFGCDVAPGYTQESPKVMAVVDRMVKLENELKDFELFLVESPANKYQPPPHHGFIAFRSHKRRIFVAGTWPKNAADLEVLSAKIKAGDYIDAGPVDQALKPENVTGADYVKTVEGYVLPW